MAAVAVGASAVASVVVLADQADAGPGEEADAAAVEFLDRYVEPDGRVVRWDQGGDTVSEGQAYGMLLAVSLGDEARFRAVWTWTQQRLQRPDGLLAWRWTGGAVVDHGSATDADLLAAAALAMAADRFADGALRAEALRISGAVLGGETVRAGSAHVLVAGPWAAGGRVVNPSYLVVGAMSALWWAGDHRWASVAATSRSMLVTLTAQAPHLPPDWSTVDGGGGGARAAPSPAGASPRYSYDAARVLVQLAVDCRAAGQRVAARAWPFLDGELDAGRLAASYALDGRPLDADRHPVALVAAASSAAAAGDGDRADALLDEADRLDDQRPSYYGAAWIALGRAWLDTDRLGGCRPGQPTVW